MAKGLAPAGAGRVRAMRTCVLSVLFAAAGAAAAAAQRAAAPMSFVPADAAAVVRVQCGARWAQELGATRVGKALTDPALQDAWTALLEVVRGGLNGAARDAFTTLPDALAGYGGEIAAALWLDWSALPTAVAGESPPMAAVLAFGPDGRTDLAAIARAIDGLLPGEGRLLAVPGGDVTVHELEHGVVTRAFERDGCLVVLAASGDLAAHAARFLAEDRRPLECDPAFGQALVAGLVLPRLPVAELAAALAPDEPVLARLLPQLGLGCVTQCGWLLRADGAHCDQEAWLELAGDDRGALAAAFPPHGQPPALLALVPPDCRTFAASHFDLQAGYAWALRVWQQLGDLVPMTPEAFQRTFTEATKLDLHADLIALAGDELLALQDLGFLAAENGDEELDGAAAKVDEEYGDTCYVLALRDGARFGRNFEQLVRSRGLHAGRKSEQYAGAVIHRLTVLGAIPLEYTITDTFAAIGVGGGEGTARNLRAVLDAAAARERGARAALPDDLARVVAGMPGGWSGLEAASLLDLVRGLNDLVGNAENLLGEADLTVDDAEPDLALLARFTRPLQRVMRAHGADLGVTTRVTTRSRVTWHSRL